MARTLPLAAVRLRLIRFLGDRNVRFWHIADNSVAPAFVRYWTKADNGGFWLATACPFLTLNGHSYVRAPRGTGSRPNLASVLQEGPKNVNYLRPLGSHLGNPG